MDLRWAAGCFSWTFCWMRCSLAVKFQKRHGMFLKHIFRESSFRQSQPSTYIVWDIIRTPEMSTANNYCLLDQSVQSTKTCKHDMIIRFYAVMQGYDSLCNCPVFQVVGLVFLVSEGTLQHNVRKIRRNGEGMTCISQLPMACITAKMPSSKSVSFPSFSWPFLMMIMIWNLIATLTSSKNVQEKLLGNDWCWYKHILLSVHQFYVATKFPYYCGTAHMPITFCLLPTSW
jgi:hypothetical protein